MSPQPQENRTVYGAMPDPWGATSVTDGDIFADPPNYRGEWVMPRSVSPSPPQTQEITISGSARNTQFPILVGSTRAVGELMGLRYNTTLNWMWLAYRIGEAPPDGLSSITNIKINGEDVSEGTGAVNTGLSYCYYCKAHLGAQSQAVDANFDGLSFGAHTWDQRHQGTAWIALILDTTETPNLTTIPVVTCEFDAGSIDDWDGSSRALSNPAAAAYYLLSSERFGLDASASSFNVTEWDAWADFCDVDISGEARWTVNGAITGQSFRDSLELVMKHGFGALWFWGDEWHVGYIKTHASAASTITQDDFAKVGGLSYTNVSRTRLPNRVFCWFTDEANERDDCRVAEASDMTPANCRETQARLELCTSADMAQRWATTYLNIMKEESRVAKCTVHPGVAKNLAPYERVDITSEVDGQTSARQWRVVGISPRMGGVLDLDLRQYSSTALSSATSEDTIEVGNNFETSAES